MSVKPVSYVPVEEQNEICPIPLKEAVTVGAAAADLSDTLTFLEIGFKGMNGVLTDDVSGIMDRWKIGKGCLYEWKKQLFNSLFIDPDLQGYSESGSHVTPITIEKDQHYTSLPTEVYYLQRTDLGKLDESFASKVSDKEYDELRKNCELIWSGETDDLVE